MYSKYKKNISVRGNKRAQLYAFLYSAEQNATHIELYTDTLRKSLNGYVVISKHSTYLKAELAVRKFRHFKNAKNGYYR